MNILVVNIKNIKKIKYFLKNKKFKFTPYNEYESNELIHCLVCFVPAVTIECAPAYNKGKSDSCWISYRKGHEPKSKEELERHLGMSIQSWE